MAPAFGTQVVWCNRYAARREWTPGSRDREITTLADLPPFVGAPVRQLPYGSSGPCNGMSMMPSRNTVNAISAPIAMNTSEKVRSASPRGP